MHIHMRERDRENKTINLEIIEDLITCREINLFYISTLSMPSDLILIVNIYIFKLYFILIFTL